MFSIPVQIIFLTLATIITLIWFVHSVCAHMYFKLNILVEIIITLGALIWFLLSVVLHVENEVSITCKHCITLTAFKWFVPNVFSQMFTLIKLHPIVYFEFLFKLLTLFSNIYHKYIDMVCSQCVSSYVF